MERTPPGKTNPILVMSKPDLMNECERRGISTDGNVNDLRQRILEHQQTEEFARSASPLLPRTRRNIVGESFGVEDSEKERSDDDPHVITEPGLDSSTAAFGTKPDGAAGTAATANDPMALLVSFMMKQEEERRRETEERRRIEKAREEQRRHEEIQRCDRMARERLEESKRWEAILRQMSENRQQDKEEMTGLIDRIASNSPPISSNGSSVVDFNSVKRSVIRLEGEAHTLMDKVLSDVTAAKPKENVKVTLQGLHRLEQRLEKILDEKMDQLEGDENKDALVARVYKLMDEVGKAVLKGEKYVSHAEWVEREEAKAGPLPAGVKVPKFDGSILKYQKWWDHFRSLIHENKRVSQFWKMQYLLQAMEGVAASVLAGFEGLASEYPEALETVQKRYGKEHLVVRHIIHSVMNRDAPTKEAVSFGSFIEDTDAKLKALENHKATRDMILLPLIEHSLPSSIRMDWE